MTESEKQEWLEGSQMFLKTITPLFEAQKAQSRAFVQSVVAITEGRMSRGKFDTRKYLSYLQEGVQKAERLIQLHSELVTYLQNTDAAALTLEDVMKRTDDTQV